MKNFLRALRHAWPYRRRLIVSAICAMLAAVLWGLNFTSIYPVLKLLHTTSTPQQWVDDRLRDVGAEIDGLQHEVAQCTEQQKDLDSKPPNRFRDQLQRKAASDLLAWRASSNPPPAASGICATPATTSIGSCRRTVFERWSCS